MTDEKGKRGEDCLVDGSETAAAEEVVVGEAIRGGLEHVQVHEEAPLVALLRPPRRTRLSAAPAGLPPPPPPPRAAPARPRPRPCRGRHDRPAVLSSAAAQHPPAAC